MPSNSGRGRPAHNDILTPREWQVVHAVQHGLTNRQIAARKGISIDAVKFHVSNALQKLGLRSRQELRAWFRAPIDSALRQGDQVSSGSSLGPIGQIARTVRNIDESKTWYGEVLGLPHLYTFGTLAFFDCAGTRLMLTQNEAFSSSESILYLRVADMQKSYDELKARGVEFIAAPHRIHTHADGTEEWMAFFKDPEGRPLALMAQIR